MQRIVQEGVEYLYHEHERVEIRILCLRDVIINIWKPEARPTDRIKDNKRGYYADPSITIIGLEWYNLIYQNICTIKKSIEYAIDLLNLEGHNLISKNFSFDQSSIVYKVDNSNLCKRKFLYDSEVNTFTVYEDINGSRYLYLGYGYLLVDEVKNNRTGALYCWVELDKEYNLDLISTEDSALVIRDNSNNLVRLNTTVERIKFVKRVKQLQPYRVIAYISDCLHSVRVVPYNGGNINNY